MNGSHTVENKFVAWAVLLLIGILWGTTIPLTKVSVSTGYQSLGLIFWQLVIGIATLGGVLLAKGWRPNITKEKLVFYCIVAIIGTIVPNGFSYLAASQLPAGVMAIAIATVPMFSLAIALGLRIEAPALKRICGVFIGFIAMVLIVGPEASLPEPEKAIFVLVALLAPLFYGFESNYIAVRTPAKTDAVSTLFMASCCGLIFVAPMAFLSGQWINPPANWQAAEYALVANSVIHALTYVTYIWLIGYGGPVFSVQVAYPVTISGVILSVVFLEEAYSGWIWASLVLVIIALFLVQPKQKTQQVEGGEF